MANNYKQNSEIRRGYLIENGTQMTNEEFKGLSEKDRERYAPIGKQAIRKDNLKEKLSWVGAAAILLSMFFVVIPLMGHFAGADSRYVASKREFEDACAIFKNEIFETLIDFESAKFNDSTDKEKSSYESKCSLIFKVDGNHYIAVLTIDNGTTYKDTEEPSVQEYVEGNRTLYASEFTKNYYEGSVAVSHYENVLDESNATTNAIAKKYAEDLGVLVYSGLNDNEDYLKNK